MKKFKKGILYMLKKFGTDTSKKRVKFDNLVLNLALQKIDSDSLKFDGKAVYSADQSTLVYVFNTDDSFKIPEGVEIIGRMAFRHKKLLKNVTIPSTVKVIEKDAFCGCENIDNVYIPATVKSVKECAFAACDNLHKVTFAGELKHLSRYAFEDCGNLQTLVVPSGSDKTFRKALRIKDDMNLNVVEKVFSIMPAKPQTAVAQPKPKVAAKPKAEVAKPKVAAKPKAEVAKPKPVVSKPKVAAKPKAEVAKPTPVAAVPKAEVVKPTPVAAKPKAEVAQPKAESTKPTENKTAEAVKK